MNRIYTLCNETIQIEHELLYKEEYQFLQRSIYFVLHTEESKQLFDHYISFMNRKLRFLSPADAYRFGLNAEHRNKRELLRQFLAQVYLREENQTTLQKRDELYQELCLPLGLYCNVLDQFNDLYHECEAEISKRIHECISIGLRERNRTMKEQGLKRKLDRLGRVVIPKEFRDELELLDHAQMEIFLAEDCIIIKRADSHCAICGVYDGLHSCKKKHICQACLSEVDAK